MEFNRGMVGVLIVVLSLIASVGLGVITNIDERTTTEDVEKYVADITGAFQSEREQSYVTFNPASNFNGYTSDISNRYPVIFNESSYTNNYPIKYTADTYTRSLTGHVSDIATELSLTTGSAAAFTSFYGSDTYISSREYSQLDQTMSMYATVGGIATDFGPHPVIEMSDLITALIADGESHGDDPTTIKITIPATVSTPFTWSITDEDTGMDVQSGPWYFTDNYLTIVKRGTSVTDIYKQATLESVGAGNTLNVEYTYSISTGRGVFAINNTTIAVAEPSQFYISGPTDSLIPRLSLRQIVTTIQTSTGTRISQTETNSYQNTPAYTDRMTISTYYGEHTEYLDTRYGVGIHDTGTITWSNGEANGVTDIMFSAPEASSDYSNTAILNITSNNTNYTDTFTISKTGGSTYISTNGDSPLNIGAWNQVLLRIDTINGTLTVIPVSSWSNFNTYTLSEFRIPAGTLEHTGDLRSIDWTANNSFRLQVINTDVFLNTYGVVMLDPSITISSLWPNYTRFAISFGKVATVGNSITIGNITYQMEGNMIKIPTDRDFKLLDISTLKLYYEKITDGDTSYWDVKLVSGKTTHDISIPNTYIGLGDKWYFNAAFYNIEQTTVQKAFWNSVYEADFQFIFFFMAAAVLIMGVVAYKNGYLDGLSMIILITTEVILIVVIGGN